MDWVVLFLLFLSFILVYKSNRTSFYIYSIFFPFVGFFLLNKIGYDLAYTVINAELIAFLILACSHRFSKDITKFIFIYLIVYLVYFFLISIFQHVSFLVRWNDYKSSLIYFVWGCMLFDDIKKNNVSSSRLIRFFFSLVVFELVISLLQYNFEPVRAFFRDVNYIGMDGKIKEIRDDSKGGLMYGTLSNVTNLANFLSLCFVICTTYFSIKNLFNQKKIIFIASILIVIMLAGIRASLLISLIMLVPILLKYKQQKLLYVVAFFFILVTIAGGFSVGLGGEAGFEEGGFARSLSVFNYLSDDNIREQTTLGMTFGILQYFLQSPLFGVGLHYNGGYMLRDTHFYLEDFSYTDAMLVFQLVEVGIVGVIIYLWPLWKFMKITKGHLINKSLLMYLFILLILSTIVDSGFMANNNLLLFFFSVVFFVDSAKQSYDMDLKIEQ